MKVFRQIPLISIICVLHACGTSSTQNQPLQRNSEVTNESGKDKKKSTRGERGEEMKRLEKLPEFQEMPSLEKIKNQAIQAESKEASMNQKLGRRPSKKVYETFPEYVEGTLKNQATDKESSFRLVFNSEVREKSVPDITNNKIIIGDMYVENTRLGPVRAFLPEGFSETNRYVLPNLFVAIESKQKAVDTLGMNVEFMYLVMIRLSAKSEGADKQPLYVLDHRIDLAFADKDVGRLMVNEGDTRHVYSESKVDLAVQVITEHLAKLAPHKKSLLRSYFDSHVTRETFRDPSKHVEEKVEEIIEQPVEQTAVEEEVAPVIESKGEPEKESAKNVIPSEIVLTLAHEDFLSHTSEFYGVKANFILRFNQKKNIPKLLGKKHENLGNVYLSLPGKDELYVGQILSPFNFKNGPLKNGFKVELNLEDARVKHLGWFSNAYRQHQLVVGFEFNKSKKQRLLSPVGIVGESNGASTPIRVVDFMFPTRNVKEKLKEQAVENLIARATNNYVNLQESRQKMEAQQREFDQKRREEQEQKDLEKEQNVRDFSKMVNFIHEKMFKHVEHALELPPDSFSKMVGRYHSVRERNTKFKIHVVNRARKVGFSNIYQVFETHARKIEIIKDLINDPSTLATLPQESVKKAKEILEHRWFWKFIEKELLLVR